MYGGQFRRSYGWYIKQVAYRLGIDPSTYDFIPDRCPEEVINEIFEYRDAMREAGAERELLAGGTEDRVPGSPVLVYTTPEELRRLRDLERKVLQMRRRLTKRFENLAREEFGFRPVGEAWVSESLLAKIIGRLLPGKELRRNERPAWLQGLELDVFVPALKLGIEYQGKQHFEAVPAWGGEAALVEVQRRDAKKRLLCEQHGVTLVLIDFTEPLTEEHVASRLRAALGPRSGCP